MPLTLHAHPLSSYCQKVLTALYETGIAFEYRMIKFDAPETVAALAALWPMKRMPVLVDDGATIIESTVIIEHLDLKYPHATKLVPVDAHDALEARLMDRIFDNYVMTPMQKIVFDSLRPASVRDAFGVDAARAQLDTIYEWLDGKLADRQWAAGDAFGLADCAAAPALFYADWCHAIPDRFASLRGYRARLLARPSFARAVDEGRPYRHLFPLGAPDRD